MMKQTGAPTEQEIKEKEEISAGAKKAVKDALKTLKKEKNVKDQTEQ